MITLASFTSCAFCVDILGCSDTIFVTFATACERAGFICKIVDLL